MNTQLSTQIKASREDIKAVAAEIIRERGLTDLPIEVVIESCEDEILAVIEKRRADVAEEAEKERRRQEAEKKAAEEAEKKAKIEDVRKALVAAAGMKPVTVDNILKFKAGTYNPSGGGRIPLPSDIPAKVETLREQLKCLPSQVFKTLEAAAALRGILCQLIKLAQEKLKEPGIDSNHKEAVKAYYAELQKFIDKVNVVLITWGENPREARADRVFWQEMDAVLEKHPVLSKLLTMPKPESVEDKAVRQKRETTEAARNAVRVEIQGRLVRFAKKLESEAEAMACRVVKKYYDEARGDVYEMLLAAAIGKQLERPDDIEYDPVARAYAQAGELIVVVNGDEVDAFRDLVKKAREKRELAILAEREQAEQRAVSNYGAGKGHGGRHTKGDGRKSREGKKGRNKGK